MLFIMDKTIAMEFAAVADAASKDHSRPTLCLVSLELDRENEEMTLRAVATDSYMLGQREYKFWPGEYDNDKDFDAAWFKGSEDQKSPVLVDAKEWKKALKDAVAVLKGPIDRNVIVVVDEDGVTITAEAQSAPEVTLRNHADEHSFPKYRSLMTGPMKHMEGEWPVFNATKLAQVSLILSAKPSDRGTFPVQVFATAPQSATTKAGPEMRPWLFIQTHERSRAEILLMPVRL